MKRKMMANLLNWKNGEGRKPLLLKGVRQVGKTHLLKSFGKQHFPSFHYFNFKQTPQLAKIFEPDLKPKRILDELSLFLGQSIDTSNDLVIFDEIQECPKALTSLKYFQEECPEAHLCGAGSLLGLHLSEGSFPVGKVTFETLRPMCFEEFLMAINDKSLPILQALKEKLQIPEILHGHLWTMLKHYFIVGGLPEAVSTYIKHQDNLFECFSKVRKKQDDLLKSYYADIAKHSGKINAMHIERIFASTPAQLSRSHDGSSSRFRFRGVIPGVSHYDRLAGSIDWLEAAGLVIKVPIVNSAFLPFKGYEKENFFKLFLFDVGLLGMMNHLSPKVLLDANYGSYKGYFAESFALQELVAQGKDALVNWQEKKSEIEFLYEHQGEVIPLEIKSGNITRAQSLQIFSQKYACPYQVIFSGRPLKCVQREKLHYYPLYLAGFFPLL